ncbi:MAG TPA: hypothetical protein VFV94_00630 [Polyangiaceae bacterium]|nr:hypothetical protein [Polyangiaceae bacterium]
MSRPGDHPDFFRLPPPPGRSRESTIRLDARGQFLHDGNPVEHAAMARAFASWIARHPDDGRYVLTNGYDWTYFEVEDAPFFVDAVKSIEDRPWLVLFDGSEEPLDPATLTCDARGALSSRVKDAGFVARFRPNAQLGLAPWLAEDDDGALSLVISGVRYPLPAC